MRKRTLVGAAAAAALATVAIAPAAFADAGGVPNDSACHGQVVAFLASNGFSPGQIQKATSGAVTASDVQDLIKNFVCAV
jgi:hypothetical protein